MRRLLKQLVDRAAAYTIAAGGVGVILCVIAVVLVVALEALPLFHGGHRLPARPGGSPLGVDVRPRRLLLPDQLLQVRLELGPLLLVHGVPLLAFPATYALRSDP